MSSFAELQRLMDVEAVAVAAVLAAVAVWLARSLRPRRRWAAIAAAALLAAGGAATAMLTRTPPVPEAAVPLRPVAVPEDGFVSSRACRSCHPHEYSAWHDSYHRRMTQVATPETVAGDFDGVTLEYHGDTYVLGHDDELFWFDLISADSGGEPRRIRRPILLTTGSHHMQAYWYPVGQGRAMEFFAFVYLLPEQRWVPRESIFLQPTVSVDTPLRPPTEFEEWQDNRRWNHSCLHCHTTAGQPQFPEIDTRVAEFGIACEACHGPGEEHVERNRDPLRRYRLHLGGAGDPTIVEPSGLAATRGSQVCGVCHGVNYPRGEQVKTDFTTGHSYRPGDDLEATRIVCRPDDEAAGREPCPDLVLEQRFWSDGMLRVSGREYNGLIESPCFEGGEFSCFSCHRMHQPRDDPRPRSEWASDQLAFEMQGNAACLQCHGGFADAAALTAHTRHAPESRGSQCYDCHMPYTSYGLLKALRSHQVDSPSVAVSLATGRPNACNQCHLDKTLAWSAGHLEAWYGQPVPSLDGVERRVPASLIWLLSGDAGQRALMAWSLGWEPAREASGSDWMAPFLAQLLVDPYDAVRILAGRSLAVQPGFEDFDFDPAAGPAERLAAAYRARQRWAALPAAGGRARNAWDLVDDPDRELPEDVFTALLARRDDRVVILAE